MLLNVNERATELALVTTAVAKLTSRAGKIMDGELTVPVVEPSSGFRLHSDVEIYRYTSVLYSL